MKTIFLTAMILISQMATAQTCSFITYNIRYGKADDGENHWDLRKAGLVEQLKFYEPDVFGVQEALDMQVEFLDSALTDYTYYGVGRDDGKKEGEFSAIFYKKEKFKALDTFTFWLSETPEKVSKGWDAALPRVCSATLLESNETKQKFWVFNTHFDHVGVEARKNSAKLIVKKIKEHNTKAYPVVLMGDFNLEPESEAIQHITSFLSDSKESSKEVVFGPEGTFSGFDYNDPLKKRIDYIFTDQKKTDVLKYAVLTDSKDRKFYSDHLPVYVLARFR